MEAVDVARAAISLTGAWFPYPVQPKAVRVEEMVLAGVARCRRLLEGMVELHESPDLAGNLARTLFETWLSSVYLLLGKDVAYERMKANDDHLVHKSAKQFLERIENDGSVTVDRLRKQAEAIVREKPSQVGTLSVEAMAGKVRKLLLDDGDQKADFPLRAYESLYRPESYMSVHGGMGAIRRHVRIEEGVGEIISGPLPYGGRDRRLELATAMFAGVASRTAAVLRLDHSELDELARTWLGSWVA